MIGLISDVVESIPSPIPQTFSKSPIQSKYN